VCYFFFTWKLDRRVSRRSQAGRPSKKMIPQSKYYTRKNKTGTSPDIKKVMSSYGTGRILLCPQELSNWLHPELSNSSPHPIHVRPVLILSLNLRLRMSSDVFHARFQTDILYPQLIATAHAVCPAHHSWFDNATISTKKRRSFKLEVTHRGTWNDCCPAEQLLNVKAGGTCSYYCTVN
jgi:hypothetical protein